MEGQLSEQPLAELISEILEKRFSGALRVHHERVKAVIYFDGGELIYATSNLRSSRLTEYLEKRGLPAKTNAEKDALPDPALGEALIAKGLLTRPALNEVLAEQVTDVVRMLLLWTSGQWSFDGRARLSEPIQVQIPIKQFLLDAVRGMDPQFAASRFRNPAEVISPDSADLLNLSPTEGFLLSRVESPIEVGELVAVSGLPEREAQQAIYGLVLAKALKREFWPNALRTDGTSAPKSSPVSGKPAVKSEPARDAQQELEEFLQEQSQATTHYQVLNVSPVADAGEIKRAYYALARRFHPDRFHDLARTPIHARLESAFARITQAHELLSNPNLKSAYDVKIMGAQKAGTLSSVGPAESILPTNDLNDEPTGGASDLQLAAKRFQEGIAALQGGQTNVAISLLSTAARLAPTDPKYRAYYGRALATNQRMQRLAEAELQVAVKLDPGNASYRVMLAGLYGSLGFSHRAIAELERALSLDPQNTEARQMLQRFEAKK